MLPKQLQAKGLAARRALYQILVEHFSYERRWSSVSASSMFADFAHFVVLLEVFIVELHAQAVCAIQLSAVSVVTLNRTVNNFYEK